MDESRAAERRKATKNGIVKTNMYLEKDRIAEAKFSHHLCLGRGLHIRERLSDLRPPEHPLAEGVC